MIVLADLSTTSSKHMFLFSTAPPFYNTTSAMPIMLHLQRTAARYMCWGYTLLWGRQICPLGIPHGTGSFRDSPCSSCNVLWHVLPGEVCKSRYLSCWYLLSVLLQLVRVGVGRAPVMGCQHMQQFIQPGCKAVTHAVTTTLEDCFLCHLSLLETRSSIPQSCSLGQACCKTRHVTHIPSVQHHLLDPTCPCYCCFNTFHQILP